MTEDSQKPSLFDKFNIGISTYFSVATSILVSVIIIALICFISARVKVLSGTNQENLKKLNSTYAGRIIREYKEAVKDKSYTNFDEFTSTMVKDGSLIYAYALNNEGLVDWTTNKEDKKIIDGFVKKPTETNTNQWVVNSSNLDGNVTEISEKVSNHTLKLGFTSGIAQRKEAENFILAMRIVGVLAIILAIFLVYLMGGVLKKPFDKLAVGIHAFSKGNFKYRIQKTMFKEINRIAESYNEMASQLYKLYESLEQRVRERTLALQKTTTTLEESNRKMQEAQGMLVHSEKMRSLGELVAGIAHEINNPVNFIYGNVIHLENYANNLFALIDMYKNAEGWLLADGLTDIKKFEEEIDYEFIKTDVHDLIQSCKEGAERTKNIVLDLKNFSRLDEMVFTEFDIPKEIDTTLNILTNKFKNKVEIVRNYNPNTPKIEAYGGQLNQVFMNILDNSIHAIKEKGTITINVFRQTDTSRNVVVEFRDTGVGISQENLKKVFDPFYTTKPVGEGTGLGMSIVYKVITSHGGTISVASEVGKGTAFRFTLPITQKHRTAEGKK